MIERQVIVTWYTPEEKTPGEDEGVIATVSGDVNGTIIFSRAIMLMYWSKDEGWYSDDYNFTHLTVHAWCDLDAYEG